MSPNQPCMTAKISPPRMGGRARKAQTKIDTSRTRIALSSPASRGSPGSFAVEIIVILYLRLNVRHRLDFVGKLCCIQEVRIDFGEIHHREVERGELLDRETLALLLLGRPPGLPQLHAALLLENPRQLAFKAAIGRALGLADAQETR